MGNLILDEISATVKSQLDQQAASGVRIVQQDDVPDTGPVRGGVWLQIPEATAVFVDLKGSTGLNARFGPEAAAHAYNYFNRAMAVILNGFQARYVDVQGDGLFGLFSGKGSRFLAAACAITMKTQVETLIAGRFRRDVSADWELRAGIGVDRGPQRRRQSCWCVSWGSGVPRQPYLPVSVASLRNVTETLAPGVHPSQR